jgi:Lsr2
MSTKQVVTITDDIDGRAGAETVTFAYAGRSYEIDLGKKNRAKLEKALEPFIAAARRTGSSRPAARRPSSRTISPATSSGLDPNAIRAWATEQGIEVAKRGRLAKNVLDAFLKAH